jgi:von Willebrand factor
MKSVNVTIEAENVACSGAFSENMNTLDSPHPMTSLSSSSSVLPSCTKSLTIKFSDNRSSSSNVDGGSQPRIIRLKQAKLVLVDGYEISKLPWDSFDGNTKIRQASSTFIVGE